MKIAILSCFYPFRGGIAQFNANLLQELGKNHHIRAFNFKRQYPSFLFPGKTQFVTDKDMAIKIESTPVLDTINPVTYLSTAREINRFKPDLLIMRYWMSFFAPSQGFVARKIDKGTKIISILDNVVPHERRFFDSFFTRYYLNSNSNHSFVVLSQSVGDDLLREKPDARYRTIPHPIYNHFGKKIDSIKAKESLGLDLSKKTLLFFGLIREYKGLDILLNAFDNLDNSYQLVIAGEPYGSFESYLKIIETSPSKNRIKLFTRYIDDNEVSLFFSASDAVVLPYRTATQSGISAICYHFDVPMVTTDVGGLKEAIGKPGTGVVVQSAESSSVSDGIKQLFNEDNLSICVENIKREKERLSWPNFVAQLTDFYQTL